VRFGVRYGRKNDVLHAWRFRRQILMRRFSSLGDAIWSILILAREAYNFHGTHRHER
jgi:hypothetical protein